MEIHTKWYMVDNEFKRSTQSIFIDADTGGVPQLDLINTALKRHLKSLRLQTYFTSLA